VPAKEGRAAGAPSVRFRLPRQKLRTEDRSAFAAPFAFTALTGPPPGGAALCAFTPVLAHAGGARQARGHVASVCPELELKAFGVLDPEGLTTGCPTSRMCSSRKRSSSLPGCKLHLWPLPRTSKFHLWPLTSKLHLWPLGHQSRPRGRCRAYLYHQDDRYTTTPID
jgi:hypothetical protein